MMLPLPLPPPPPLPPPQRSRHPIAPTALAHFETVVLAPTHAAPAAPPRRSPALALAGPALAPTTHAPASNPTANPTPTPSSDCDPRASVSWFGSGLMGKRVSQDFTQVDVDGIRAVAAGEYTFFFGVQDAAQFGMGYAEHKLTTYWPALSGTRSAARHVEATV